MRDCVRISTWFVLAALAVAAPLSESAQSPTIGIVLMHGKGGSPTGLVSGLAGALAAQGYLVTSPEMPWSGRRGYDVPVSRAEEEVTAAVAGLRDRGAERVFIAGHSQGGLFALHMAAKVMVDGVIAIAPGGSVANRIYRQTIGDSVAHARRLVAEGKGDEATRLEDYEGNKGTFTVVARPAVYLTWFEPDGAMNMERAARAANPRVPVLWLIPQGELPALRKINLGLYSALPFHSLTRLAEPDSDHLNAPSASIDEIVRWTREVAGIPGK